jgi:hypothetical protein
MEHRWNPYYCRHTENTPLSNEQVFGNVWRMKHIYKVRIFNSYDNSFRYPDQTGHFYIHKVHGLAVWDNNRIWQEPFFFHFAPAIVQQFVGHYDLLGHEIYEGCIPIFEIAHFMNLHTLWLSAMALSKK